MTSALSVRGVSYAFGRAHALDDVSFEIPPGRFTALLGPNGAGKTTLFNLITGLYAARAGVIEVCGHDIRRAPRAALARLGVVFQSRALDASLTVAQNLAYQAALHGIPRREARPRAERLCADLGLSNLTTARVARLSGGQAQRAEIARAMMNAPKLLLCDEASTGLDMASRRALLRSAHALAAEDGVGVLWATHLVDEVEPDDAVIVLHRGRVMAQGRAAEIAGADGLEPAFVRLTAAPAPAEVAP